MGQQASKAAAQRAVTRAAAAADSAAACASATKQVPRTHPSNTGRFQRGDAPRPDPRDASQHEFLRQRAGGATAPVEMPEDLVRFLKDVGPLKKRRGQDAAKKKAGPPSSPEKEEQAPTSASSIRTSRRREFMPLASNVEGFETERTTNFSYDDDDSPAQPRSRTRIEDEEMGLYDVLGLYRIVAAKGSPQNQQQQPQEQQRQSPAFSHNAPIQQRIRDVQQYLDIPVIIKESEEDGYLGVPLQRLEELRIDPIPKTVVKLVLEDLSERQDQEEGSCQ